MKLGLLLLLSVAASAQEPRFQARAHEVLVPVSVMQKGDKPVESLTAKDFTVLSDGQPQAIRMIPVDSEPLPIHAVFVLETDSSSQPALAKIKKTASLISMYIANDMGTGMPSLTAVVTAADEVRVVQDFSANPDWLQNTFEKLSAEGGAARLIDGVNAACDLLAQRKEAARRVIVLIGASHDSDSKAQLQGCGGESAEGRRDHLHRFVFPFRDCVHPKSLRYARPRLTSLGSTTRVLAEASIC